jgi:hypothetical protein
MKFEPDELLALAKRDAENARLEEALAKLKDLIGAKKPTSEALLLAGRIYAQFGLLDRARAWFRTYVPEGWPSDAQQHLDLLLKSGPVDNFYAERGKELLQPLSTGRAAH